ncbi:F-box only protein 47-like [Cyprinodon tularosa]|uniref:F-box only protein 47-like n=1 Tax=Cyprinodon tularosa TaxID=77115 RepID=UPI0018E224FF|nr:F-box only protein 47-like [Cyprinodon tularosa]XP_038132322.1 F-box only protein 47-like [Cyprinodon tularosa]
MMVRNTSSDNRYSCTRKSRRLMTAQQHRPVTRSHPASTAGCFTGLPAEVLHMILDQLSMVDISVFSMVSKEITSYIVDYVSSQAWRKKNLIQSFHDPTCLEQRSTLEHYRQMGLLFKRCTMLLPTKDRLKFIFSKFSQIPCFMLGHCTAPACNGYSRYGVFLQTLIAGWDELECHRVFNFLCNQTNFLLKTEALLTLKPGLMPYQEYQLRFFCRKVLLDPCQNQPDGQFWLVQLLKPWPMVRQAHLLLILYGPVLHDGFLGWQDLVERGLPHAFFLDLAKGILMLFGALQVKGWSTNSMISVLDELIVIPQPWYVENVARLLVLCGNNLCYTFLASKALSGRLREISRIIIHIILVCEKDGYSMSWVVKLVQQICSVFSTAPEKFNFIKHLENMFSEVTREFFEFSAEGNNFEDRETFQTLYILLSASASFHTKLLHKFLK